jgi:hypothetical protein
MKIFDHPLVQFIVFGFSMMAFFILVKTLVNMLPPQGIAGDIQKIALTA